MANTYPASGFACIDGVYTDVRTGGFPGGNDGALFMCLSSASDYQAIRSYDGSTQTIHFFGRTWGNGTLGNSVGSINIEGVCGVTFGPWNGPQMVLRKSDGYVGIGTTNPSYKLQVVNSGAVGMSIVTAGSTSGNPSLQLLSDSTDSTISSTSNGLELTAYSAHALLLKTTNVERMRITAAGKVGIGTTSPVGDVRTDVRSSCPLTAPTGQPIFFGSNDVTGPLGIVVQHICGNGVCRADITSTRYGVSGNDLSLNVDSSDPNTGGGLYIQYRGGVGIGTSNPTTHNGRGFVVRGTGADTRGIIELWDSGGGKSVFQQVGGNTYMGQLDKATGGGNIYMLTGGQGTSATISMTILCAGNVGIGTVSPASKLDVCGPQYADLMMMRLLDQTSQATGTGGGLGFGGKYNTGGDFTEFGLIRGLKENGTSGEYGGYLSFLTRPNLGQWTERMKITSAGNVGIGTASPSQRLHVTGRAIISNGTGTNESLSVGTTSSSTGTNFGTIDVNGLDYSAYYLRTNDTIRFSIFQSGGVTAVNTVTNIPLTLGTCDTERMRITNAGNVGIGTSSPIDKFEVAGGIHTSGTASASKACTGYLDYYLGSVRLGITGPNTTSPAIFRIDQYSSNASISCTPFYITATSNIGVNTTSPSYRLHVNGTFYAAGSSIKYKEGICNYDTNSCLFMCLKPVAYQYKDEFKHLGKELKSDIQIGLIAEDVAEVMPELAILVNEEDNKVVRNVDYEKLSIVLLAEVQKLRQEMDQLKAK